MVQILLLPLYLWLFLGTASADLLRPGPFVEDFLWLIAVPLVLAWLTELWAGRQASGERFTETMAWAPVPLTLFLVMGAEVPRINNALGDVLGVVPAYIAYVVAAPIIGWMIARLFRLDAGARRALVFSASTRNSPVVLPLALAAPFDGGLVAAVVVTQTFVELQLAYIRVVPKLWAARATGSRR